MSKNFKNHVIKTLSSRTWRHYYSQTSKRKVPTHSPPKENCHDCVLDVLNQELQKNQRRKKKLFSKSEFFCKLPDWKRWAIFHYTKAKRTLISVKSQPLEKRKNSFATLELYCQASPRLDFNFYPIVRLQNKTWCVLVLLLPLCLSVLFIWQEKKLSSRFETIIRLLLRKKTTKPSVYSHCWLCT